jgi:hypothetical protein
VAAVVAAAATKAAAVAATKVAAAAVVATKVAATAAVVITEIINQMLFGIKLKSFHNMKGFFI